MNTLHSQAIDIHPFQRAGKHVSTGKTVGNLLLRIRQARLRRQTIRELSSLNDAQLADIGIPRHDIHRAVDSRVPAMRHAKPVIVFQQPEYWIRKEFRHAGCDEKIAA